MTPLPKEVAHEWWTRLIRWKKENDKASQVTSGRSRGRRLKDVVLRTYNPRVSVSLP